MLRAYSGVGTIAREIVFNTVHHYNWVQVAGSVKHPEKGRIIDLGESTNSHLNISDSYVKLYPVDGYGEVNMLRALIKAEQPDAIMLITDPRYFTWLFMIENEIRSQIPIIYLNIWDNLPLPYYNKPYYESCDLLLGISKQTKYINETVLGDEKGNIVTEYLPHGLNTDEIYAIDKNDANLQKYRENLFNGEEVDFTLFFNSRNIKRKQVSDTIMAFKEFLDSIEYEDAKKCRLVLHVDTVSNHGTDLGEVIRVMMGKKYKNNCIIHDAISSRSELNLLYNIADLQILISSNEGWGLSLTEALLTATPILANVTGGMQDQMRFEDENGKWFTPSDETPSNHRGTYHKAGDWVFPVFPATITLQGSPRTPYIYDDICTVSDVASQIKNAYNVRHELKERGKKGYEWAISDEAGFTSVHQALRFMEYTDNLLSNWVPRKPYEIINITKKERETCMIE